MLLRFLRPKKGRHKFPRHNCLLAASTKGCDDRDKVQLSKEFLCRCVTTTFYSNFSLVPYSSAAIICTVNTSKSRPDFDRRALPFCYLHPYRKQSRLFHGCSREKYNNNALLLPLLLLPSSIFISLLFPRKQRVAAAAAITALNRRNDDDDDDSEVDLRVAKKAHVSSGSFLLLLHATRLTMSPLNSSSSLLCRTGCC